jgi:AmmeMemoRadiSam system protein A
VLDPDERRALLALAREAIQARILGLPPPRSSLPATGRLTEPGAAFATLYVPDASGAPALRGCIGTFDRSRPLGETVQDVAVSAAVRDPRFPPLQAHEIPALTVSISVLTPLERTAPERVEVGRHGIQISRGEARGVLLPQVATEHGWDRETFLSETCRKAGLPRDAWQDPATRVDVFEAEVFGEPSGY